MNKNSVNQNNHTLKLHSLFHPDISKHFIKVTIIIPFFPSEVLAVSPKVTKQVIVWGVGNRIQIS